MISESVNPQLSDPGPETAKVNDGSRGSANRPARRLRRNRILAATVLLAGVAATIVVVLSIRAQIPRGNSLARIGAPLPPFLVVDRSGRVVDASKAQLGKRTIIVFYSPSCDVCHSELPKLYPIPRGLSLIIIDVGGASSTGGENGLQCDAMFYDRDRVFQRSFPIAALPTILFVDDRAVLNAALVGAHERDLVQNKLIEFARPARDEL